MAYNTLGELMRALECEKYPECWEPVFNEAMADFEQNGCPLADEEYYENLHNKYGILNLYRPLYNQAAVELAQNEPLARFMVLICRILRDRKNWKANLAGFERPKPKEGTSSFVYDMFDALALCSLADICYENMRKRKIPNEISRVVMDLPEKGIREYMIRHDGRPGHNLLEWLQYAIDGEYYRIGRFEIQLNKRFGIKAKVFKNQEKEIVVLADGAELHKSGFALGAKGFEDKKGSWVANLKETETEWIGYRYLENAYVENTPVVLKKDDWTVVLSKDDFVVDLHIPSDGKLTPESVDETIALVKDFMQKYYPDYDYKAFTCSSWLLDPQLSSLLGENSNISMFNSRFTRMALKSDGDSVFYFVFRKPDTDRASRLNLECLPEQTTLERILKGHYLEGKVIYGTAGFFFA